MESVSVDLPGPPPQVPDANPTGLYRRRFDLPEEWRDRRVVLHIGGAESVLYVWLNGALLGMSKDSRLPAEFDLTPHLRPDENAVALFIPANVPPGTRLPITGLRPHDALPTDSHVTMRELREVGAIYIKADPSGGLALVFPKPETYDVLLISAHARRPKDTPIAGSDLSAMQAVLNNPSHLIGEYKYRWFRQEIRRGQDTIAHDFGPNELTFENAP